MARDIRGLDYQMIPAGGTCAASRDDGSNGEEKFVTFGGTSTLTLN